MSERGQLYGNHRTAHSAFSFTSGFWFQAAFSEMCSSRKESEYSNAYDPRHKAREFHKRKKKQVQLINTPATQKGKK